MMACSTWRKQQGGEKGEKGLLALCVANHELLLRLGVTAGNVFLSFSLSSFFFQPFSLLFCYAINNFGHSLVNFAQKCNLIF